jgi:AcrR family transcriptional regulator
MSLFIAMPAVSSDGPRQRSGRPLYRKLTPRPNGLPREKVVANQRARLHGAVIEASAVHGYVDTSVAELCRLAGISKRTFYEQFDNKQACFRASYECVVARAAARIGQERPSEQSWDAKLASALAALLEEIAERPKDARFVLLEALAADGDLRSRHAGLRRDLEAFLVAGFGQSQPESVFPPLLARGVLAGFERVICDLVLADHHVEPAELVSELVGWAASYGEGAAMALSQVNPAALEGMARSSESREGRLSSDRARILRAAAAIAVGNGCEGLTLSAIARRASVELDAVARYYDDPRECLNDAKDLFGLDALISLAAASRSRGDGLRGACAGLLALMHRLADDRVMRDLIFLAPSSAPLPPSRNGERLLAAALEILLERIPVSEPLSAVASLATVGALQSVISHRVACGEAHSLPTLGGYVAFLALAPAIDGRAISSALASLASPVQDAGAGASKVGG